MDKLKFEICIDFNQLYYFQNNALRALTHVCYALDTIIRYEIQPIAASFAKQHYNDIQFFYSLNNKKYVASDDV